MSNIVINGTTYNGIESITVKDTSGSDVKYTKGERPSGTIEITENGIHNVADYESANVNVPVPEPMLQEKTTTQNGEVVADEGYDGLSKVIVNVATSGGEDRLQWKCDNIKSLYYEFYDYKGTDFSFLEGLDTSQVEDWYRCCTNCTGLIDAVWVNLQNAKDIEYIFNGCTSLKSIGNPVFDNVTSMSYSFSNCSNLTGTLVVNAPNCTSYSRTFVKSGLSEIFINTDNATNLSYVVSSCKNLTKLTLTDTSKVTNFGSAFEYCDILESISPLDLSSCTSYGTNMFQRDYKLKEIHLSNTQNCTNFSNAFIECTSLETLETIDMYKITNANSMLNFCKELKNLTLKNIKISLQIGYTATTGTTFNYGELLTNASLLNTAQELWDNTDNALGGTRTLKMSTPSKTAIQSIYVKLVDVTDEMIANDQYISNKKPCVECASTDEGAMTVEEYIISKNWSIA